MRSINLLGLPLLLVMAPAFADIIMPNSVNCGGATQVTYDSGGTACIANGAANTPPPAGAVSGSPTPVIGTSPSTGAQPAATPAPVAAAVATPASTPIAAAPATVPAVTPPAAPIAAGLAAPAASVAGAGILSGTISGMGQPQTAMQQYFPSQSNLQPQIDSLRNKIADVESRSYAGSAAAIAHSSLQSVPLGKDHSLSAALGSYGGQSAVAFGLSSKLNEGWSSRFSVARDRYQTSFSASGAYSW